jgi:D-aminoacyl-tRNA deacylase
MEPIAIIVSSVDPAGMNIKENLLELGFERSPDTFEGSPVFVRSEARLFTLSGDSIRADHLDDAIQADLFIFATKHQSSQGVLSLSVHVPGNWGQADMGGKERSLCVAPASFIKEGFLALRELNQGFEVTVEQTHHGPFLSTPSMFIEIGGRRHHR